MSDLVKRLRSFVEHNGSIKCVIEAADRIEQLEAEIAIAIGAGAITPRERLLHREIDRLNLELTNIKKANTYMDKQHQDCRSQLAAEKALADQYRDALSNIAVMGFSDDPAVAASIARYAVEMARKARVL